MSHLNFTLKSFALEHTRALHEDTIYLAVALSHKGVLLTPLIQRIGNVNNGVQSSLTKNVNNMTISIDGTYGSEDTFTFSYILINHGGGTTTEVENDCSQAFKQSALTIFNAREETPVATAGGGQLPECLANPLRAADDLNTWWNQIKSFFKNTSSNHCDGPVAIDRFSFKGSDIAGMVLASQQNPFSINYLGIDSAIGCGSNSHYSVQWLVGVS